jgi:Protein of unknown function (DUF4232)
MSVVAPPEPPRPDELELLIREARARQRKRWMIAAAAVAGVAALGLLVSAVFAGGGKPSRAQARPPVGAALPLCRTPDLRISFPLAFAATGHEGGWLRFANAGAHSCALSGWPTITAVEPNGTTLPVQHQGVAAMWVPLLSKHAHNAPRLSLGPGQSAIAEIQDGDVPLNGAKSCPTARSLRIGVPGDRHSVTISARLPREATNLPLCYLPGVSPFVPLAALPH